MVVLSVIPPDLSKGAILLSVIGTEEIRIENYKGIFEYSDERILILGRNCRLEICGSRLTIQFYTADEMKVTGCIKHIHYL